MYAPWKVGDAVASDCSVCGKLVWAHFELRTVTIPGSRLRVRDVLVNCCPDCAGVVGIPRQSLAQLREAGVAK
ncbi:MAG: hypothetical protein NVS1B4_25330 [Gemmatimonadaceae bacterium]